MGRVQWVAQARGRVGLMPAVMVFGIALLTWPAPARAETRLDLSPYIDAPGGVIQVPAGTYNAVTSTLVRSDRLVLVADGPVVIDGGLFLQGATNLTVRGSFLVRGPVQVRSAKDITLDGIEITNPGVSGGAGIVVNRGRGKTEPSERVRITGVYIHDTYDDAIRIGAARDVVVEGVVARRIFDVPGNTCSGEKCHDDAVQVMGPSTSVVVRNNDLGANVIFKTDLGDINAELSGNLIHDDHNAGVHIHEVAGTDLRLTLRSVNYVWNHPAGALRITGSPTIVGQEFIVASAPPANPPPPSPDPPAPANPTTGTSPPTSTVDSPAGPSPSASADANAATPPTTSADANAGTPPPITDGGNAAASLPPAATLELELGPDDTLPVLPALTAAALVAINLMMLGRLLGTDSSR